MTAQLSRLALVTALTCAALPAQALELTRLRFPSAGFACQGALPAFAGTLRTRPLGVLNEGADSAFVTCSFEHSGASISMKTSSIGVRVINQGTANLTVSCTLVNGYQDIGTSVSAQYVAKNVVVGPGGGATLSFGGADVGNTVITNPNLTCSLPPKTGITYLTQQFQEDVGQ